MGCGADAVCGSKLACGCRVDAAADGGTICACSTVASSCATSLVTEAGISSERSAACELPLGKIVGEDIGAYHRSGAIGSTMFRVYLNSPREYWLRYVAKEVEDGDTAALKFGRIAHGVILEGAGYVVVPEGIDRRTKAGKEEYDRLIAGGGGHIVDHWDGVTLDRILKYGLGRNEAARELLAGCGEHEVTYRMSYRGKVLQCRPDGIGDKYVVELKTCRSIGGLLGDFFRLGYHIQAAWYNHVLTGCGESARDFEFIGVSKEGGYECTVIEYKWEEAELVWKCLCQRELDRLVDSLASGIFENKHGDVVELSTPERVLEGGHGRW